VGGFFVMRLMILISICIFSLFTETKSAVAQQKLSSETIKEWCSAGHSGKAPDKITMHTWNQFDLIDGFVNADMQGKMSLVDQLPEDSRKSFWADQGMLSNGPTTKDEYLFATWLKYIGEKSTMSHPLPNDVDAIKAIAVKLKAALSHNDPIFKTAEKDDIKRTRKALKDFDRFNTLLDKYAPLLQGACK